MENKILGLHHITAIANNARRNADFYTKVLGLRMVKKTVNFDDPTTYHFYYGNEKGEPGTILTFFPWEGIGKGENGTGMATNIGYAVPADSLQFWKNRFKKFGIKYAEAKESFGEQSISFVDPDGLEFNLIVGNKADNRKQWLTAEINENVAVKGFHSVTLTLKSLGPTAAILTDVLGYTLKGQEGNKYRFSTETVDTGAIIDIIEAPEMPAGKSAGGTNHHIAFRVKDEESLMEFRRKIAAKNIGITNKIDRDYFFSVYFREPGGVLFELATENPGFTVDEPLEELGKTLKLPKQYENSRTKIEKALPDIA